MSNLYVTTSFIERSKKIHNNYYDYSKVICTKFNDRVIIICPVHGEFTQLAYGHITGRGCRSCANSSQGQFKKTIEEKHSIFYDLKSFSYKGILQLVTCVCPVHGVFEDKADRIVQRGCKRCRFAISEKEDFVAAATAVHGDLYDYVDTDLTDKTSHDKVFVYCKRCETSFDVSITNHIRNKSGCPSCRYIRRSLKYSRVNNETNN